MFNFGSNGRQPYQLKLKHHFNSIDYFTGTTYTYCGRKLKINAANTYSKGPVYEYRFAELAQWAEIQAKVKDYLKKHNFQPIYHERERQLAHESDTIWRLTFVAYREKGDDQAAMWRKLTSEFNDAKWRALYSDLQKLVQADTSTSKLAHFFNEIDDLNSEANLTLRNDMDRAYAEYNKLNMKYMLGSPESNKQF